MSMRRKLLILGTVALLAAVFILPSSAQVLPFSGFSGLSPFGTSIFGYSPFGTSYTAGYTTVMSYSSGFATINGIAIPFGSPFLGYGYSGISPFDSGLGFGDLGLGLY